MEQTRRDEVFSLLRRVPALSQKVVVRLGLEGKDQEFETSTSIQDVIEWSEYNGPVMAYASGHRVVFYIPENREKMSVWSSAGKLEAVSASTFEAGTLNDLCMVPGAVLYVLDKPRHRGSGLEYNNWIQQQLETWVILHVCHHGADDVDCTEQEGVPFYSILVSRAASGRFRHVVFEVVKAVDGGDDYRLETRSGGSFHHLHGPVVSYSCHDPTCRLYMILELRDGRCAFRNLIFDQEEGDESHQHTMCEMASLVQWGSPDDILSTEGHDFDYERMQAWAWDQAVNDRRHEAQVTACACAGCGGKRTDKLLLVSPPRVILEDMDREKSVIVTMVISERLCVWAYSIDKDGVVEMYPFLHGVFGAEAQAEAEELMELGTGNGNSTHFFWNLPIQALFRQPYDVDSRRIVACNKSGTIDIGLHAGLQVVSEEACTFTWTPPPPVQPGQEFLEMWRNILEGRWIVRPPALADGPARDVEAVVAFPMCTNQEWKQRFRNGTFALQTCDQLARAVEYNGPIVGLSVPVVPGMSVTEWALGFFTRYYLQASEGNDQRKLNVLSTWKGIGGNPALWIRVCQDEVDVEILVCSCIEGSRRNQILKPVVAYRKAVPHPTAPARGKKMGTGGFVVLTDDKTRSLRVEDLGLTTSTGDLSIVITPFNHPTITNMRPEAPVEVIVKKYGSQWWTLTGNQARTLLRGIQQALTSGLVRTTRSSRASSAAAPSARTTRSGRSRASAPPPKKKRRVTAVGSRPAAADEDTDGESVMSSNWVVGDRVEILHQLDEIMKEVTEYKSWNNPEATTRMRVLSRIANLFSERGSKETDEVSVALLIMIHLANLPIMKTAMDGLREMASRLRLAKVDQWYPPHTLEKDSLGACRLERRKPGVSVVQEDKIIIRYLEDEEEHGSHVAMEDSLKTILYSMSICEIYVNLIFLRFPDYTMSVANDQLALRTSLYPQHPDLDTDAVVNRQGRCTSVFLSTLNRSDFLETLVYVGCGQRTITELTLRTVEKDPSPDVTPFQRIENYYSMYKTMTSLFQGSDPVNNTPMCELSDILAGMLPLLHPHDPVLVLIGPSGAGKTTSICSMVSGAEDPEAKVTCCTKDSNPGLVLFVKLFLATQPVRGRPGLEDAVDAFVRDVWSVTRAWQEWYESSMEEMYKQLVGGRDGVSCDGYTASCPGLPTGNYGANTSALPIELRTDMPTNALDVYLKPIEDYELRAERDAEFSAFWKEFGGLFQEIHLNHRGRIRIFYPACGSRAESVTAWVGRQVGGVLLESVNHTSSGTRRDLNLKEKHQFKIHGLFSKACVNYGPLSLTDTVGLGESRHGVEVIQDRGVMTNREAMVVLHKSDDAAKKTIKKVVHLFNYNGARPSVFWNTSLVQTKSSLSKPSLMYLRKAGARCGGNVKKVEGLPVTPVHLLQVGTFLDLARRGRVDARHMVKLPVALRESGYHLVLYAVLNQHARNLDTLLDYLTRLSWYVKKLEKLKKISAFPLHDKVRKGLIGFQNLSVAKTSPTRVGEGIAKVIPDKVFLNKDPSLGGRRRRQPLPETLAPVLETMGGIEYKSLSLPDLDLKNMIEDASKKLHEVFDQCSVEEVRAIILAPGTMDGKYLAAFRLALDIAQGTRTEVRSLEKMDKGLVMQVYYILRDMCATMAKGQSHSFQTSLEEHVVEMKVRCQTVATLFHSAILHYLDGQEGLHLDWDDDKGRLKSLEIDGEAVSAEVLRQHCKALREIRKTVDEQCVLIVCAHVHPASTSRELSSDLYIEAIEYLLHKTVLIPAKKRPNAFYKATASIQNPLNWASEMGSYLNAQLRSLSQESLGVDVSAHITYRFTRNGSPITSLLDEARVRGILQVTKSIEKNVNNILTSANTMIETLAVKRDMGQYLENLIRSIVTPRYRGVNDKRYVSVHLPQPLPNQEAWETFARALRAGRLSPVDQGYMRGLPAEICDDAQVLEGTDLQAQLRTVTARVLGIQSIQNGMDLASFTELLPRKDSVIPGITPEQRQECLMEALNGGYEDAYKIYKNHIGDGVTPATLLSSLARSVAALFPDDIITTLTSHRSPSPWKLYGKSPSDYMTKCGSRLLERHEIDRRFQGVFDALKEAVERKTSGQTLLEAASDALDAFLLRQTSPNSHRLYWELKLVAVAARVKIVLVFRTSSSSDTAPQTVEISPTWELHPHENHQEIITAYFRGYDDVPHPVVNMGHETDQCAILQVDPERVTLWRGVKPRPRDNGVEETKGSEAADAVDGGGHHAHDYPNTHPDFVNTLLHHEEEEEEDDDQMEVVTSTGGLGCGETLGGTGGVPTPGSGSRTSLPPLMTDPPDDDDLDFLR